MSVAFVAVIKHDPELAVIVTAPVDELIEHAVETPALNVTEPVPEPPEVPAVMLASWYTALAGKPVTVNVAWVPFARVTVRPADVAEL